MTTTMTSIRGLAAVLCAAALWAPPAQAALLFEQPPALGLNEVMVGSESQGATLVETFVFAGTGDELAWWGTAIDQPGDLSVELYAGSAGSGLTLLASTTAVTTLATAWTIAIDDGSAVVAVPVFRYSIDLQGLSGGAYALSVRETGLNTPRGTWYWLTSNSGDGDSFSVVPDLGDLVSNGVDLSLQVSGQPLTALSLSGTLPLLLLCGLGLACTRRPRRVITNTAP